MLTEISYERGAYALVFRIAEATCVRAGALGAVEVPAGIAVYVGSAHGPGGLRARVRRHLRKDKPQRWHIDALTARIAPADVIWQASSQRLECTWVRRLLALPGAYAPIHGFGSSDCAERCPAHLISMPDTGELGALRTALLGAGQEPGRNTSHMLK